MIPETFPQSVWSALSAAGPQTSALDGDVETDVLIVGAGFLGLSTALHLAEAGVRVLLVEADEVGFGASGRNTGFVVPSLKTSLGPAEVRRRLGAAGDRLTALVGQSGTMLFDLIRRLGIDCAAEQTGWMQPAHTAALVGVQRQRQSDWRALGREIEILSADETGRRLGFAGYHGAYVDPTGGQLNPLAYARGLARAAIAAGVRLHERTRVGGLSAHGGRWTATTAGGRITAGRVLLTTNALVNGLAPQVASSLIPVRAFQIATQRFSPDVQARIMAGRAPVADTRRHTFAVRWSPDGRLLSGGAILPGPNSLGRASAKFARRLERLIPGIGSVRVEHCWTGTIAVTDDFLPRFMALQPGLDAAIGCNGRGVALTTTLGREIAGLYAGQTTAADFPLAHEAPRAYPAQAIARHGPALWLPWSEMRDWIDTGTR